LVDNVLEKVVEGVVGDEEPKLRVASFALSQLCHKLTAILRYKESRKLNHIQIFSVDARRSRRELEIGRLRGTHGFRSLSYRFTRATGSNGCTTPTLNLIESPLIEGVVGISRVEKAEFRVGALLFADAIFENGAIARYVTGCLFKDISNLAGRKDNSSGRFDIVENGCCGGIAVGCYGGHCEEKENALRKRLMELLV
jgi:hypothetical protein